MSLGSGSGDFLHDVVSLVVPSGGVGFLDRSGDDECVLLDLFGCDLSEEYGLSVDDDTSLVHVECDTGCVDRVDFRHFGFLFLVAGFSSLIIHLHIPFVSS